MPTRLSPTRTILVLSSVVLPAGLVGCVPQNQYDDLMTAYRSQEQQLLACQSELESSRANETALRSQLGRASEDLRGLERFRDGQRSDIDQLVADYEALLRQVNDLKLAQLPEGLSRELQDLAARFPDVLSFDPRTGLIRFNADFTFDLGDATLKAGAQETIRQLAHILNNADAAAFEVKVVGHTDTVPIRRSATAAKHPTNVHLSAHRAISVRDALVASGVRGGRVQVAGWGEFRPMVANGPRGAAENRRVEVYLTAATGSFDAASAPAAAPAGPAPAAPRRPVDDDPVK